MQKELQMSFYKFSNWYVIPDGHHPSKLEGNLLEITLKVGPKSDKADMWLAVIIGFHPRHRTVRREAAYVLRRSPQMAKIGFKPFGPSQNGRIDAQGRIVVTFVCSGESLWRRDESNIFRLLSRICNALGVRIPANVKVTHRYNLQ